MQHILKFLKADCQWILILSFALCACVDEYEADIAETDEQQLVVEGTIVSDSLCTFYLSHTMALNATETNCSISDARVSVQGDDGSSYTGRNANGCYRIAVGHLDPDHSYSLKVVWRSNVYTTEPAKPLSSPGIASVTFEQQRDDGEVDFLITPEATSDGQKTYYCWTYDEIWMIRTPLTCYWDIDWGTDSLVRTDQLLNEGWVVCSTNAPAIASSSDYAGGQIKNCRVYSLEKDDTRFTYRYQSTVHQRVISQAEYEYLNLSARQTDDMGGLFTPQPSALPTNIICTSDASCKAVGYVGVAQNVASRNVYVGSTDVGHSSKNVEIMTSDQTADMTVSALWSMSKRPYFYMEETGDISWCSRWCVDVTDSYWGNATLEMPESWVENPDNN